MLYGPPPLRSRSAGREAGARRSAGRRAGRGERQRAAGCDDLLGTIAWLVSPRCLGQGGWAGPPAGGWRAPGSSRGTIDSRLPYDPLCRHKKSPEPTHRYVNSGLSVSRWVRRAYFAGFWGGASVVAGTLGSTGAAGAAGWGAVPAMFAVACAISEPMF